MERPPLRDNIPYSGASFDDARHAQSRMQLSTTRPIAILALLLALSGCRKSEIAEQPPLVEAVARVGPRNLTLEDYKRYLQRNAGTAIEQTAPEASSALLDQYIEETLLAEHAARSLGDVPASEIAASIRREPGSTINEKRDEIRRQKLLSDLSTRLPDPTPEQIALIYNQNPDDFQLDERVRVRQILIRDEETANQITARLRKGEKFEELSLQFSEAANAKQGGDIGFISRGQLPKTFEDVIFALSPGEFSRVIKTDSSFHIFKVDDHQEAGAVSLEMASPLIRQRINDDQMRKEISTILTEAQKISPVSVFPKRLPFPYSGTYPKG